MPDLLNTLQLYPALMYWLIALMSACCGSFLNVVIYRLPVQLQRQWRKDCFEFLKQTDPEPNTHPAINLCWPKSHCPQCQSPIKLRHNLPLISFLLLRRHCASCQQPIAYRYIIVELLTIALGLLATWQFGLSATMLYALVFSWMLIPIFFIDLERQFIPDELNLGLLWVGLVANLNGHFTSINQAVLGACIGYLLLWSINYLFQKLRGKQGMGHGDFKLMAAVLAWLGLNMLATVLLFAVILSLLSCLTLLLCKKIRYSQPVALGPAIAISAWCNLFWGEQLQQYSQHLLGF